MYVRIYVCMYVCIYVYVYVCMYVCMYIHTYTFKTFLTNVVGLGFPCGVILSFL